jgi:hypothetical protein
MPAALTVVNATLAVAEDRGRWPAGSLSGCSPPAPRR